MLDQKRIACIHAAKSQIKMSEEVYRMILHNAFAVSSSKDLNIFQFEKLMDVMKAHGYKPPKKKKNSPVSKGQKEKIKNYESKLGWNSNPERLTGFIKRQTGADKKIEELTSQEAQKMIEALKAIWRREDELSNKR